MGVISRGCVRRSVVRLVIVGEAMTPQQHEQKAREFLSSISGVHDSGSMGSSHDEYVRELVAILADTERATLERVADEMERHPYWSKEAEVWIKHLRQLAKEIHP